MGKAVRWASCLDALPSGEAPQSDLTAQIVHFGWGMRENKTVAVIGASSHRHKPNEPEVEGHKTFASVLDVPGAIDMATVYVPAGAGLRVMDELAQKGVGEVWLNPGADDDVVVDRARGLGLKVVQACSIIAIGESPSRY
jgi:predicted CoA-binding protein